MVQTKMNIKVKFVFSNASTYLHTFEILNDKTPQEAWDAIRDTLSRLTNLHTSDGVFINMNHVNMVLWVNNPNKPD